LSLKIKILQKSKESFGNDFTVILEPKAFNSGVGEIARIKLNLNGKVYSPIVFEGDANGCDAIVKNAQKEEQVLNTGSHEDQKEIDTSNTKVEQLPGKMGIYWAASFEAIAAGMQRCHQFSTPSLEGQRDKLIKKYGSDLKDIKIIGRKDGSHVLVANRHDQTTGENINYAYFDSLAACDSYQDQILNVHPQGQPIIKQNTNRKANYAAKGAIIQEVRDEMDKEGEQLQEFGNHGDQKQIEKVVTRQEDKEGDEKISWTTVLDRYVNLKGVITLIIILIGVFAMLLIVRTSEKNTVLTQQAKEQLSTEITETFNGKYSDYSTQDLLEIWQTKDTRDKNDFEAARQILVARGVDLYPQKEKIDSINYAESNLMQDSEQRPNAEFSKVNIENKGIEFLITPAEAPKRVGCFFIALMLFAFAGFIAFNDDQDINKLIGFASLIGISGLVTLLFTWQDGRPEKHKIERKFRVYKDSIELPEITIKKRAIDRFIIRNGITKKVSFNSINTIPLIMAIDGNRDVAMGMAIGNAIAEERQNSLANICYSVEVETEGQAFKLAAGLHEITAFAILKDIGRIMKMNTTG
jgi:hypothetical protein